MWYVFFFILATSRAQNTSLGWNDMCNVGASPTICFIWNNNPYPFNSIEIVANGPNCRKGCMILLYPYSGTCRTLAECSTIPTNHGEQIIFSTSMIKIKQNDVTISSMDQWNRTYVTLQNNVSCTILQIQAHNVQMSLLDFSVSQACQLSVDQDTSDSIPVIYFNSGGIVKFYLKATNTLFAVVLILQPPPNLVLDYIVEAPSCREYEVIVLEAKNATFESYTSTRTFFLGTSSLFSLPNSNLLNVSSLTNSFIPPLNPCPPIITIQLKNCPNSAIFPALLSSLIIIILIAIVPSIWQACDKAARKGHRGALQRRPIEDDDDQ